MKIVDLTKTLASTTFEMFANAINAGGSIRAINAKGLNEQVARKYLDKLTNTAKLFKAKGLMSIRNTVEGINTSLSKFLTEQELSQIIKSN